MDLNQIISSGVTPYVTGSYFDVDIVAISPIALRADGRFMRVSGLSGEFEYEVYNEGGANYPRYFFKQSKPQTLILEQGTVITGKDNIASLMHLINTGFELSFSITITLKDHAGNEVRSWMIIGAHLSKYEGPALDSNQSEITVSRMEFLYNGAF